MFGRFSEHRERRPRERERHRRYFPAGKDGWTNVQRVSAEKSAIAGKTSEGERAAERGGKEEGAGDAGARGNLLDRDDHERGKSNENGKLRESEVSSPPGTVRALHRVPIGVVPFPGSPDRDAHCERSLARLPEQGASEPNVHADARHRGAPGDTRASTRPRVAGLSLRSCGEILPSDEEARRAQRAGGVSVAFLKAGKHEDGRGCRVGRPTSETHPTDLTW